MWRDRALLDRLNAVPVRGCRGTAESVGILRYHRADAHAAGWAAAGLTAARGQALPAGAARDQIEAETEVRATAPHAVLGADERLVLPADLAALPGQRRDWDHA